MTSEEKLRWTAFVAVSFLFHAAALAWLNPGGADLGRLPSKLTVLLKDGSAGEETEIKELPTSAFRSRDLFDRPPVRMEKVKPMAKAGKKEAVRVKAVNSPERRVEKRTAAKAPEPEQAPEESMETTSTPRAAEVFAPAPRETQPEDAADEAFSSAGIAAATGPVQAPHRSSSSAAVRQGRLLSLLHQAISRQKRYPMLAVRQRREGTTTVSFSLSPSGEMDAIDVDRSSGFSVLDTAAVSAVGRVAPFAPARVFLSDVTRFKVDVTFKLD